MTTRNPVIVVIEDDPQIRRFLRTGLQAHGFEIHEADTGRSGLIAAQTRKPDLVLLDLGLPDMEGVEVVKELRAWTRLPVIVLSARVIEGEKVAALDAGADDYVTKPFGLGELLARIRVALRHFNATARDRDGVFSVADLKVDLARRRVFVGDSEARLTPIEYRLLSALVRSAGKVLTHRQLLKDVWGPAHIEHNHYLRIYMANLRHKLEKDPARPRFLLTEAGVGYRLSAE